MFEQSLLDLASPNGKRRWTVLAGTAMQCSIVGLMILLPLIYTEAVPKTMYTGVTFGPPAGPAPKQPASPQPRQHGPQVTEMHAGQLQAPTSIPDHISIPSQPEEAFTDPGPTGPVVIGGTGPSGGPVGLGNLLRHSVEAPPEVKPKPAAPAQAVRVGGDVQNAKAISRPQPLYPRAAIQTRTQGTVRLEATISRMGTIENLKVLSGHPLLIQAALEAVQQWRYRPTILNGEPVEVITTIDVVFTLGQ